MTSVAPSSQKYSNQQAQHPQSSQLATKNTQKQQHQDQAHMNYRKRENGSPGKSNIDNLYDQSVEQLASIQAGSSLTIAASQRHSQMSVRDYQNNEGKQNYIKQNQSPWRRNINNQNIVIGSKNGFYNNNNDTSTISSLSAQKQHQQLMSPYVNKQRNHSTNQSESQQQQGRNNMGSSYFLHFDVQQVQHENPQQASSKNNQRNNSHLHRNNNFSYNSPLKQQNSIASGSELVQQNHTTKSQQRKILHRQRKTTTGDEPQGVPLNYHTGADTPQNPQGKQKKHPLTARGSVDLTSYQKKLRLHSLNANLHRIFKEDKYQQLNNQFTSDSTDQSQKQIECFKEYKTRASQDNIDINDQSLASNINLNIDESKSALLLDNNNADKENNDEQQQQQQTHAKDSQKLNEEKGTGSGITACGTDNDNNLENTENENKMNQKGSLLDIQFDKFDNGNGYEIEFQNPEKKIQSYTEDTNFTGKSDSISKYKRRGSKNTLKMLYTEPDNESRRKKQGKKLKLNKIQADNPKQQMHTQEECGSGKGSNYNRALVLSNSPRNAYNYRGRSSTQASTVAIPPKINMSVINGNDQSSPKGSGSQNDSPLFVINRQKESQENICLNGSNPNHLYFISNSPLLKCKVTQNGNTSKSGQSGMNAAMKNYINNSIMIKQSYLNLQQQMQGKQCRTQVDSSINLKNQQQNRRSSLTRNGEKEVIKCQHLSLNQGDSIQQQNYQFQSLDEQSQMKISQSKLLADKQSKNQVSSSQQPLKEIENQGSERGNQPRNSEQVKNKLVKQVGGANHRFNSFQQQHRAYINNEINNNLQNNNVNITHSNNSGRVSSTTTTNNKSQFNGSNKHINTSQDKKQNRGSIRSKVYSTNSSNHSLNASILEKSQLYVEKYKNNLQNDLSLIHKIDKQKQIRENDLYNVNYYDKKYEYAQEIDKKIQYLSHQKIEPSDLKSNQQRYLNSYSPRINQNSQAGYYQNFHQSSSSQSNNPYSPLLSRGNTQQNDYNNIHTSLSHITSNENQENQINDHFVQNLENKQIIKNDNLEPSGISSQENDSVLNSIWRKLTYQSEKGRISQSSLEEELQKIDFLSKKNEKALNQYVQIKEDAIFISQFMEQQKNQKKSKNQSQGDI